MISAAELATLMKSDTPHAVLDLRERGAYQKRHIFRATSLPRRHLELRLPTLVPARPTAIVIYDDTGALSALALPTLRAMGYSNVLPLGGGLDGWIGEGRPTAQGVNTPSKVFGERVLHDLHTPEVTCRELDRRMAAGEDMVIVDTRTPEEYARGCLPGAWSMPGGELVLRLGELVKRPDTTIVVHCGGRTRSYLGAESVRRWIPNPIVAVKNGTMGWELAGLELERGASRWPPEPSPARSGPCRQDRQARGRRRRGPTRLARRGCRRSWRGATGTTSTSSTCARPRSMPHRTSPARSGRRAGKRCKRRTSMSPSMRPRSCSPATASHAL